MTLNSCPSRILCTVHSFPDLCGSGQRVLEVKVKVEPGDDGPSGYFFTGRDHQCPRFSGFDLSMFVKVF